MNKKLLSLSIAAYVAMVSIPSFAQDMNIQSKDMLKDFSKENTNNNFISENDYRRQLEEFLKEDEIKEDKEIVVEKNESIVIEDETINKKSESTEIDKTESEKEVVVENNNETLPIQNSEALEELKISSIRADVERLSFLSSNEINLIKKRVEENENLVKNTKDEFSSKVITLENILNDLKSQIISKEEVNENFISLDEFKTNILSKLSDLESSLKEKSDKKEYKNFREEVTENVEILDKEIKNLSLLSISEEAVEEKIMLLSNKIESNALVLKEREDVIKDTKKSLEDEIKSVSDRISGEIAKLNEKFLELKGQIETHKDSKNNESELIELKNRINEKDDLINSQDEKIKDLNKKYMSLAKEVENIKNIKLNRNVIKVNDFENLDEAEKRVKEEGGVLILDKNGQLKVLN